jgi:hypothetical protein
LRRQVDRGGTALAAPPLGPAAGEAEALLGDYLPPLLRGLENLKRGFLGIFGTFATPFGRGVRGVRMLESSIDVAPTARQLPSCGAGRLGGSRFGNRHLKQRDRAEMVCEVI